MKQIIIGSLVAAAIVFVYQAMSWMVLPFHANALKYSPRQDAILEALSQNLTEDGVYAIPNAPPGATQEQHSEFSDSMIGKPSAIVTYQKSFEMNMGRQMVLGFVLDFIAALMIAYVMWTASGKFSGFGPKLLLAMSFAVFTIFQSSLMQANWWETPWHYLSGEVIDHVIGWLLGGSWLAWWMGRTQPATS